MSAHPITRLTENSPFIGQICPVSRAPFKIGDQIVICKEHNTAFSVAGWNSLDSCPNCQEPTGNIHPVASPGDSVHHKPNIQHPVPTHLPARRNRTIQVLGLAGFIFLLCVGIAAAVTLWNYWGRYSSTPTPQLSSLAPEATPPLSSPTHETSPITPNTKIPPTTIPTATKKATIAPPSTLVPTKIVRDEKCEGALKDKLKVGTQAKVIVWQVSVRTGPGLNYEVQNVLANERIVEVLGGPKCADERWWWFIHFEGTISTGKYLDIEGWISEGEDGLYNLVRIWE